jgi:hypothetical protein
MVTLTSLPDRKELDTMSPIGSPHSIAGIIHTQVLRDTTVSDPQSAFFAQIDAPGFSDVLPLNNNEFKEFHLPVGVGGLGNVTARAEVDDFRLLPAGSTPKTATALACKLVFKLEEIFQITIGSVDITASLH